MSTEHSEEVYKQTTKIDIVIDDLMKRVMPKEMVIKEYDNAPLGLGSR
jgi:hypothetical protein